MFKLILIFSSIAFLVVSCGQGPNIPSGDIYKKNIASSGSTLSGVAVPIEGVSILKSLQGPFTLDMINRITNLNELKMINPKLADLPGKNHPKFIELQKAQMTLDLHLFQLNNPEYLKIREEQKDIFLGKEIWTQEMKDMKKDFDEALALVTSGSGNKRAFSHVATSQAQMTTKFESSEIYKVYIQASQGRLAVLNESIKKYWTPEITQLQKDIKRLNEEIYGIKME